MTHSNLGTYFTPKFSTQPHQRREVKIHRGQRSFDEEKEINRYKATAEWLTGQNLSAKQVFKSQ